MSDDVMDLIRKLRARVRKTHVGSNKWADMPDPLCQAAADKIERLTDALTREASDE